MPATARRLRPGELLSSHISHSSASRGTNGSAPTERSETRRQQLPRQQPCAALGTRSVAGCWRSLPCLHCSCPKRTARRPPVCPLLLSTLLCMQAQGLHWPAAERCQFRRGLKWRFYREVCCTCGGRVLHSLDRAMICAPALPMSGPRCLAIAPALSCQHFIVSHVPAFTLVWLTPGPDRP